MGRDVASFLVDGDIIDDTVARGVDVGSFSSRMTRANEAKCFTFLAFHFCS
jgi:hypothetical protein